MESCYVRAQTKKLVRTLEIASQQQGTEKRLAITAEIEHLLADEPCKNQQTVCWAQGEKLKRTGYHAT